MYDDITCPYCFEHFRHEEVLFRAANFYQKEQFDKTGYGRDKSEIEFMPDGDEKNEILNEYNLREHFEPKRDEEYDEFWSKFGGTSEDPGNGTIPVYDRPLIRPGYFGVSNLIYDDDGFAIAVKDPWGTETRERVCPHCHNPLPLRYGKYPVKYISVIGISGAGKTVFLSKLIEQITIYAARLGLPADPAKTSRAFVDNNLIEENRPLPVPTQKEYLTQPLFYQLKYGNNNATFVIYDIAGETCREYTDIVKYGSFVLNSNGIMLLIDPAELGFDGNIHTHELDSVLTNINSLFAKNDLIDIPLAVCISKSDTIRESIPSQCFENVTTDKRLFNTATYNEISEGLSHFFDNRSPTTKTKLKAYYKTYNFFAITTLNCDVEIKKIVDSEGFEIEAKVPVLPPNPKRIEEPLYWLFKNFGYIKADGAIYTPRNEELQSEVDELNKRWNELNCVLEGSNWGFFGNKKINGKSRNDIKREIDDIGARISELKREMSLYSQ